MGAVESEKNSTMWVKVRQLDWCYNSRHALFKVVKNPADIVWVDHSWGPRLQNPMG